MQHPDYIGEVIATLEPSHPHGICWGCGGSLPKSRKKFHNKECQGRWVGRGNKDRKRPQV